MSEERELNGVRGNAEGMASNAENERKLESAVKADGNTGSSVAPASSVRPNEAYMTGIGRNKGNNNADQGTKPGAEDKKVSTAGDDSDIETMTVDEMAGKEEKPKKTASQKAAEDKKKKKQNSKFKRFWKKRKGLIIFLLLVIIGAIAFLIYRKQKAAKEAIENATPTEFALIEKQDIRDTISTTGTIVSPKTSQLISSFKESTKITNVYFEVGDHVNEGDVVVTYSTENIEKSISETKEDIATNKQKEALTAEQNESDYLHSYTSATTTLESKSEAVDKALKDLYEACDGYGDAKRELQEAKDNDESEATIASLEAKVSTTYQTEQNAQKTYSDAVAALATANSDQSYTLSKADNSKAAADLSLGDQTKSLERQLETYEDNLEDYIVTAPISGIVTKVEVEEGNGFTSGNVMTIQRDDVLYITTEIDEYDIPSVEEGQRVVIKTDATQDDELEGEVIEIAPTATSSSSTSGAATGQSTSGATYTVKIEIKTQDDRLKLGMSAKINIITDEDDDTLVVRYDAIEEDADGNHYVRVVDNNGVGSQNMAPSGNGASDASGNGIAVVGVDGTPTGAPEGQNMPSGDFAGGDNKKSGLFGSKNDEAAAQPEIQSRNVYVEIGIEGDYYTEIISDEISEGMQVIVQSDFASTDDNPFAMMMGGGGGGGQGGGPGGGGGGPR